MLPMLAGYNGYAVWQKMLAMQSGWICWQFWLVMLATLYD